MYLFIECFLQEKNVLVTPDQQVTKIPPTFVSGDVMLSNSFHQQRDSSIRKGDFSFILKINKNKLIILLFS